MSRRIAFLLGILALTLSASGQVEFRHGVFAGNSPHEQDASGVTDFKNDAQALANDSLVNQFDFLPAESALWNKPAWDQGGAIYLMSAISGLNDQDIIGVTEDWLVKNPGDSSFSSFLSLSKYVLVDKDYDPATDSSYADYTKGWLYYNEGSADGEINYFKTTGFFNLIPDEFPDLAATVGTQFKLDRALSVYRGASLSSPQTNWLGGYQQASAIDGGTLVASDEWEVTATVVPAPAAVFAGMGLLGVLGLRRKRA
jgi:hypothetical protein